MEERQGGVPGWAAADGPRAAAQPGTPPDGGSPVADEPPPTGTAFHAGPVGGSTRVQATLSRATAYGLWGAVALALVLGLVNCAGRPGAAPPPAPEAGPTPEPVPPPGGCAELAVASWLAGDPDTFTDGVDPPRQRPAQERRRARRTYTVAATPEPGSGRWGYLVGVDVERRDGDSDSWRPAGRQFFTVTLAATGNRGCGGWSAVAPPARVPAPALAGGANPGYPTTLPVSGSALSETLAAFFTAVLTGDGSAERYLAPGAQVPAWAETPYGEVRLAGLRASSGHEGTAGPGPPADGTVARLLVTVVAEPDEAPLPLVYPVTAEVRGGRWEVTAINPVVGSAGSH